jgi:hypothetical protein
MLPVTRRRPAAENSGPPNENAPSQEVSVSKLTTSRPGRPADGPDPSSSWPRTLRYALVVAVGQLGADAIAWWLSRR